MEKILVSACLLGDKVRYDGGSNPVTFLDELSKHFEIVPFCPEVQGGLPTPRDPAEIVGSLVMTKAGKDVTANYNDGAQKALTLCKFFGIRYAILKDGSPACGPRQIHDGKFDGIKIDGLGITARLLVANGIKVYAETDNISFLWNKPTERKLDQPKRKKRRFDNRPRTLAEANAEEAAEKLARENGTLVDDEATPTGEGKPSYEHHGYGHSSYGHSSYGHGGFHHDGEGHSSYGHSSYGHGGYHHDGEGHGYGHSSYGHKPYGAKPEGAEGTSDGASFEKKPYEGHSSYGHSSYGHSSYGHKPYGEGGHSSYGHKPYGEGHSFGHKPYGEGYGYGHSSYGHKPYGEKTEGGEGTSFEKKPYEGHSSYGHKPYGEGGHSYGHKNYGHSSYGHKPEGEGHSFGHKPYGEGHEGHGYGHSSYGHKPYNKNYSHKPYNDHRSGGSATVTTPKGDEKK